jgi:uroporphyrinogen-III synthase
MLTNLRNAIIVAIGPVTSRELSKLNIPHGVAAVHTIDGAVEEARLALRELNKGYG